MGRTLAAAVTLGTLVAGCEPLRGAGPATEPVVPSNVAAAQDRDAVSFGGSAEFGVTR